jgi:hypothetical protein
MKVRELIELLSKTDPEREVVQYKERGYFIVNCVVIDSLPTNRQYSWERTDVIYFINADKQHLKDNGTVVLE